MKKSLNLVNTTLEDRIEWCQNNLLSVDNKDLEYDIVDDKLIIYGNILLCDIYEELPIKIDEVHGNIVLLNTINHKLGRFKSLKNFPDKVYGNINVSQNPNIVSLEGCPKYIKGSLWAMGCKIEDLNNIETEIDGNLFLSFNHIHEILHPENIKVLGEIDLFENPIRKFPAIEIFKKVK